MGTNGVEFLPLPAPSLTPSNFIFLVNVFQRDKLLLSAVVHGGECESAISTCSNVFIRKKWTPLK